MEYTENLKLFKYNPETDGKQVFSIDQALNYNWDILDEVAQTVYKNKEDILNITDKMMPDYDAGVEGVIAAWTTVAYDCLIVAGATLRGQTVGQNQGMEWLTLKNSSGQFIPTCSVDDNGWISVYQSIYSDGYVTVQAFIPKGYSYYYHTGYTESQGIIVYPLKGAV